jgi:hypothetical protein
MAGQSVLRPSNDEIKDTLGTASCVVFIASSLVLHWLNQGFLSLFSFKAIIFNLLGMFVAPLTIGVFVYGLSRLGEAVIGNRGVMPFIGGALSLCLLIGGTIYLAWASFHWFYAD